MKNQKVGVLMVGALGAVSTTVIAGVKAFSKNLIAESYLRTENDDLLRQLPLADLKSMEFGGWDVASMSVFDAIKKHNVVPESMRESLKKDLQDIEIFPGVLRGTESTIQQLGNKTVVVRNCYDQALYLVSQIKQFKLDKQLDQIVVVNLASTEGEVVLSNVHQTLETFETALRNNDSSISFGMIYAYAALKAKAAYLNFTPSVAAEIPALMELALQMGVPIAGKDGKTGQTLYKTVIAPMFKERALKILGWYSTNMLGNNDGLVLKDPHHAKTKIESKKGVLSSILGYSNYDHQIFIHYYGPRGDAKEAWDNVDFEGWLGEKMSMKINWLGKDSILAAPLVVDLVRLLAFFSYQGCKGIVPELACFFKSPYGSTTHHFFEQVDFLNEKVKYYLETIKNRKVAIL